MKEQFTISRDKLGRFRKLRSRVIVLPAKTIIICLTLIAFSALGNAHKAQSIEQCPTSTLAEASAR